VQLAEGAAAWALPVFCIGEFLRVVTHPRLFDPPFSTADACSALERVLGSPSLEVLSPGPAYTELLLEAVREADAVGNLAFDAQIVALCREAGVSVLLTEDRDFDRFPDFATARLS
jgi:predicted nucleic acid-binding protein